MPLERAQLNVSPVHFTLRDIDALRPYTRLGTSRSYRSGKADLPERLVHMVAVLAGPAKVVDGLSKNFDLKPSKKGSFDAMIFGILEKR